MKIIKNINKFISETFISIASEPQLETKKGFLNVLFMSLIEFAFILYLFVPYFEISDDFIMNSLASGAISGTPSPFLSFTNVIIGFILTIFYKIAPNFNWYTFYLLSSLLIGYTTIQFSFYKLKSSPLLRIIRHIIILSFLLNTLIISGFTKASTVVGLAGFVLIFMSDENKKKELLLGAILILLSALIRHHVLLMLFLVSCPILLVLLIKKKYIKLFYIGAALIAVTLSIKIDKVLYRTDESRNQFLKFRNLTAITYKNNKTDFARNERKKKGQPKNWSKLEIELERKGILHLSLDSIKNRNYFELIGTKKGITEKLLSSKIGHEFKYSYKKLRKYIEDRYYYFIFFFIILLFFLGKNPKSMAIMGLYTLYILFIAFYLHYFFEGALKDRVVLGMLTPIVPIGLYFISINTQSLLFLSELKKEHTLLIILNIAILGLFLTGFLYKKSSRNIYNRRDKVYNFHEYLKKNEKEFYVSRIINNPYYIYKNPLCQENAFYMGWMLYSPENYNKLKKYFNDSTTSIYEIKNKEINWYFDPFLLKRGGLSVIKYYSSKNENCFYKRKVIPMNRYKLYKYTFYNADPKTSEYTMQDIDTTLFNAPDSTYYKLLNPEKYLIELERSDNEKDSLPFEDSTNFEDSNNQNNISKKVKETKVDYTLTGEN